MPPIVAREVELPVNEGPNGEKEVDAVLTSSVDCRTVEVAAVVVRPRSMLELVVAA